MSKLDLKRDKTFIHELLDQIESYCFKSAG